MPTTAVQLINVDDGVVMKEYEAGVLIKIGRGPSWSHDSSDLSSGTFRSQLTKSMSQSHAILSWKADQPYIEDNKSTNGTLIEQGNHKIAITSGVQHQVSSLHSVPSPPPQSPG